MKGERPQILSPAATSGFTLIEVLVVMVVLAIAAAGVRHAVGVHLMRERDAHVERLRLALQAAAEHGLARGQAVRFEFDAQHYRFQLLTVDGAWRAYEGGNRLLRRAALPESVILIELRVNRESADALVFRARAPAFELSGHVDDRPFVITGTATGAVRIGRGER